MNFKALGTVVAPLAAVSGLGFLLAKSNRAKGKSSQKSDQIPREGLSDNVCS